jgi:hypothetical protein
MELDMELVYGDEDYEELQEYFEHRKYDYPSPKSISERFKNEYIPDVWEALEETNEEDNLNNKQRALRRILDLLQEIPSDCKDAPISETKSEG